MWNDTKQWEHLIVAGSRPVMTFTFAMGEITSAYTYGGHTHYANGCHKNVSQLCPTGLNL